MSVDSRTAELVELLADPRTAEKLARPHWGMRDPIDHGTPLAELLARPDPFRPELFRAPRPVAL